MPHQPHSPFNLTTTKDVSLTPNKDEKNEIMSILKKLPNITVFKVPVSPKLVSNSNVISRKNGSPITQENNLNNIKKVNNYNTRNYIKNSNLKQTLKQKNNNTILMNKADKILLNNLKTLPEKYSKKKSNEIISSSNTIQIKKAKTDSQVKFPNVELVKPENNIESKTIKSAISDDFTFLDLSTEDQVDIVLPSQILDSTNITVSKHASSVTDLNNSENSIMYLKTDENNKVDHIVEDTVVTETVKICDNLANTN